MAFSTWIKTTNVFVNISHVNMKNIVDILESGAESQDCLALRQLLSPFPSPSHMLKKLETLSSEYCCKPIKFGQLTTLNLKVQLQYDIHDLI